MVRDEFTIEQFMQIPDLLVREWLSVGICDLSDQTSSCRRERTHIPR
jgi:hypothetical protein